MNLYIDKENLLSMIQSRSHDMYGDCVKAIKKQFNVFCNFSIEEIKENEILSNWFITFADDVGVNNTLKFNSSFPARPLKSNSSNSFNAEQLSSIFLLDDPDASKLKNSGTVIVGLIGEEIETIEKVFLENKDYDFERKWRIGDEGFKRWSDITNFSLPLTEIIIVDPYILKNKDTATDTIDINLIEYIGVLSAKSLGKINVVVITHPDNSQWDYNTLKAKVNTKLTQITGKNGCVTLIRTNREHDRTIMTNYKRIYSGDTFSFWDNRGVKITKGREIFYSSFGKMGNHELAKKLIEDIQKTINFLKENNPEYIEGDEKSGFLNFN